MAKGSRKRKHTAENPKAVSKKPRSDPSYGPTDQPSPSESSDLINGLIYRDELETTIDTLNLLSNNPSLIVLKSLKPFRAAVHNYWRVSSETSLTGTSLTSRISSALVDQRHVDALVLLSEMQIRGQMPKLGALQRWVRECDAVLTPKMSQEQEDRVWEVLDAILRTTQPDLIAPRDSGIDCGRVKGRLRWYEPFVIERLTSRATHPSLNLEAVAENAVKVMKVLQITPGAERRPPNKHPAIIYYSPPNTFPLLSPSDRLLVPKRFDLPGVPGAFIIDDVFEPQECESLIQAAEKVGLIPDEPVAGSAVELASVLAHNLIWLADTEFISGLYTRIVKLLPQSVDGGAVKGINARFRLYRYRPGALYRPHIDGAWPASALDTTVTPHAYVYDSDPNVYSRLTLLIYLNDNFDGGCTTFFLPSATPGTLEARPVKPHTGTVCVFPHGAAKGSLLHEGSGIIGDGAKYVIRTEILYEVDRKDREKT